MSDSAVGKDLMESSKQQTSSSSATFSSSLVTGGAALMIIFSSSLGLISLLFALAAALGDLLSTAAKGNLPVIRK
jgi:hypothetical protein